MKKELLVGCISVLCSMIVMPARADAPPIYGDWITTEGTATLYREDATVAYLHCAISFKFFPVDRSERQIRIENLSGLCTHPTYWNFSPFFTPGVINLSQAGSDGFNVKIEADGNVDFLDVTRAGDGISLRWSERSFDGLNFDLSTGPLTLRP